MRVMFFNDTNIRKYTNSQHFYPVNISAVARETNSWDSHVVSSFAILRLCTLDFAPEYDTRGGRLRKTIVTFCGSSFAEEIWRSQTRYTTARKWSKNARFHVSHTMAATLNLMTCAATNIDR